MRIPCEIKIVYPSGGEEILTKFLCKNILSKFLDAKSRKEEEQKNR